MPDMPMRIADVAAEADVVGERVADVGGDRLDAVLGDDRREQLGAPGERLVPGDLAPGVAVADHRLPQPVGVVVQVAERRALGAEVALAPHVVAVGAGSARPGRRRRGSRGRTSPRTAGRCAGGCGAPRPRRNRSWPWSPSSSPPRRLSGPLLTLDNQRGEGGGYRPTPVRRHAAAHRSASSADVAGAGRPRSMAVTQSSIADDSSRRSRASGSVMHAWAMPTTA